MDDPTVWDSLYFQSKEKKITYMYFGGTGEVVSAAYTFRNTLEIYLFFISFFFVFQTVYLSVVQSILFYQSTACPWGGKSLETSVLFRPVVLFQWRKAANIYSDHLKEKPNTLDK